jgi:hypothetical protein
MADYSSQSDYLKPVKKAADKRRQELRKELKTAFAPYIKRRSIEVIVLSEVSVLALARAFQFHPSVVKPLMAICNVAARAVERDLEIKNLDTFHPKLDEKDSVALAGYLKSFLPPSIEIPSLLVVDRTVFFDKEIRKNKGRWEDLIQRSLCSHGKRIFKKRKYSYQGEAYEIDAACPPEGDIEVGVDVKRIEARRDLHKRCDEILNKAVKFKKVFPLASFAAIIYYPFVTEQANIQTRLKSEDIDYVFFASDSPESISNVCRLLLDSVGIKR